MNASFAKTLRTGEHGLIRSTMKTVEQFKNEFSDQLKSGYYGSYLYILELIFGRCEEPWD